MARFLTGTTQFTNPCRSYLINTNRTTQEATHSVRSGLKRRETVAYSRRRIAKSSSQTIYEIGSSQLIQAYIWLVKHCRKTGSYLIALGLPLGFGLVFIGGVYLIGREYVGELLGIRDYKFWTILISAVPSVTFSWIRSALRFNRDSWLPEVSSKKRIWRATIVSLILIFIVAFIIAITRGVPPLPTIQVTAETNVEGKLLTHVDRFWYVFDEQGILVALPDEEVTKVRISS